MYGRKGLDDDCVLSDLLYTAGAQTDPFDGNFSELHLIAGQRSSFVAEDVVDFAQILVQICVSGLGMLIALWIIPATHFSFNISPPSASLPWSIKWMLH